MRWLRMLYKGRIKVYVLVDDSLCPIGAHNGAQFRYSLKPEAACYSAKRANLSYIAGESALLLEGADVSPARRAPGSKKKETAPKSLPKEVLPDGTSMPPNTIVIYTDGGASPNPGDAGLGVLMLYGEHVLEIWEYLGKTTNNVAELTAILRALENVRNKALPIQLYSDSSYAIGVLTGTMRASKNLTLIAQVREEMAKCPRLVLLKVRAHVGIAHNEHVDRLVGVARETKASGTRRGHLPEVDSI
ncbi:MAG: hypothetical protein FWC40_01435 [Proteobacteria bacterium]|nr:hypothetical protein [Pseudomonadota bacterium]